VKGFREVAARLDPATKSVKGPGKNPLVGDQCLLLNTSESISDIRPNEA
jgi:hypothetical protein